MRRSFGSRPPSLSEIADREKILLGQGNQYRYVLVTDKKKFPKEYIKQLVNEAYVNSLCSACKLFISLLDVCFDGTFNYSVVFSQLGSWKRCRVVAWMRLPAGS